MISLVCCPSCRKTTGPLHAFRSSHSRYRLVIDYWGNSLSVRSLAKSIKIASVCARASLVPASLSVTAFYFEKLLINKNMIKVEITFFVNVLFHFIRLCFVHKLKSKLLKWFIYILLCFLNVSYGGRKVLCHFKHSKWQKLLIINKKTALRRFITFIKMWKINYKKFCLWFFSHQNFVIKFKTARWRLLTCV